MSLVWNDNNQLGAPEDLDQKAWVAYLRSLRDGVSQSWNRARAAYLALERTRAALKLPLIARPGEAASPGALSVGEQQNFFDAGALAHLLVTWMDEAIAGKRQVGWDAGDALVVEGLPGDAVRVVVEADRPRIVSASTGQPVPVTPVDGTVPDKLGYVVPIVIGVVAVAASAYFIVDKICDSQVEVAKTRTMETISTNQTALIAAGKATPEQMKEQTDALYGGAASVEKAKGEAKAAENESGLQKTVRTLAWVALGVGTIYLASQVIKTTSPARTAAA